MENPNDEMISEIGEEEGLEAEAMAENAVNEISKKDETLATTPATTLESDAHFATTALGQKISNTAQKIIQKTKEFFGAIKSMAAECYKSIKGKMPQITPQDSVAQENTLSAKQILTNLDPTEPIDASNTNTVCAAFNYLALREPIVFVPLTPIPLLLAQQEEDAELSNKAHKILLAQTDMGAVIQKMQKDGKFNDFINAVAKMEEPLSSQFFKMHGKAMMSSSLSSQNVQTPFEIIKEEINLQSKTYEDAINKIKFIHIFLAKYPSALTDKTNRGIFLKELKKEINFLKPALNEHQKSLQAFRAIAQALMTFDKSYQDLSFNTKELKDELKDLLNDAKKIINDYKSEELTPNDLLIKNYFSEIIEKYSSEAQDFGLQSFNAKYSEWMRLNIFSPISLVQFQNNPIFFFKYIPHLINQRPDVVEKFFTEQKDFIKSIISKLPGEVRRQCIQNIIPVLLEAKTLKNQKEIIAFFKECYNKNFNDSLQDPSDPFDAWMAA